MEDTNKLNVKGQVSDVRVKGFTLLELLIVISIIAILSVILIVVLNPAETLKKARDVQRFSDLASMKTALGIYVTNKSSPDLDDGAVVCLGETDLTTAKIGYSFPQADQSCTNAVTEGDDVTGGSVFSATDMCRFVASPTHVEIDGDGWIPVDLASLTGGSPVSNLPTDPTNSVASAAAPTSTDLVYRYACQETATGAGKPSTVFEFNATLESTAYTTDDDRDGNDGGDNTSFYEVGTSLRLIGSSTTH